LKYLIESTDFSDPYSSARSHTSNYASSDSDASEASLDSDDPHFCGFGFGCRPGPLFLPLLVAAGGASPFASAWHSATPGSPSINFLMKGDVNRNPSVPASAFCSTPNFVDSSRAASAQGLLGVSPANLND
jgi:hypothetical protein